MKADWPCRVGLAAMLAATATPALTQEPDAPAALQAVLAATPNARQCFARIYDRAHLAAHPGQKVAELGFRMIWRKVDGECGGGDCLQGYGFQLKVRRRNDKRPFAASGPCLERDGKAFCGVECDGGGLYVTKNADGSLLLSFGDSWGIRLGEECGEDSGETTELLPGKDDRVFRLDPLPAGQCPAYEKW
jgi:hypothetical protein